MSVDVPIKKIAYYQWLTLMASYWGLLRCLYYWRRTPKRLDAMRMYVATADIVAVAVAADDDVVVVVVVSVFELTVMKVIRNNNYKVYKHINISPAEMECVIFTLLLIFCQQLTFPNIQTVWKCISSKKKVIRNLTRSLSTHPSSPTSFPMLPAPCSLLLPFS